MMSESVFGILILVVLLLIAEGIYIENGPMPHQYEFMPRRPVQETNNGTVAEFGPSCTRGESEVILCRGRLPDEQMNGVVRYLHVEQCDPHSMRSLSSDDVRLFSDRLVVFKLDCEYDRVSIGSSLELKANALETASALDSFTVIAANVRRLPVGFFRATPRLVRLYLQRNRLTDVSDVFGAFADVGGSSPVVNDVLFELGLSGNLIEAIADDSFSAFVRLDTLDVSDNRLTSVQPNALRNMNNLRYLNLRGNRLTSLPDTLFVGVAAHLASIDLTDNQLVDDGIFPALDIRLTKLLVLNLGGNRLTSVDGGRSTSLYDADKGRTLLVLHFESNRIEVLPPDGVFRRLSNLTLIDFSNNSISTIGSVTFEGLDNLVNLGLSKNNLTHLDDQVLVRCCANSLMVLDVSDNRLRTLPDLSGMQRLYTLNASGNELVTLDDVHFVNETILNTVDFSRNRISSLRNATFGFAVLLRELRLNHNRIDLIERNSFSAEIEVGRQRVNTLRILRLDSNRLTSIDGVFQPLGLLAGLQQLNLSANLLESFNYRDVPYFVRDLRIANNLITELGEPFKYDLPPQTSLDFLDVSGNRITVLAANSVPESIGVLLLAANRIESIDDFALINKPRLTVLDLSDNRMTSACPSWFVLDPKRTTSGYRSLSRPRLLLSGNPLRCTCQLEWLTLVNADAFGNTFASVIDLNDAVCSPTFQHNARSLPADQTEGVSRIVRSTAFLCSSSDRQPCPCIKFGLWPGPSECSAMSPRCPPSPCRCFFDGSFSKRIVDCSMARLNAPPSNFMVINATVFYLDGNSIDHLNRTSFGDGDLSGLSELYLNASHLTTIEDGTFESMAGLMSFYLQDNRLTSLSAGVFVGLARLRILNLSGNRLARINHGAFSPMIDTLNILGIHSNRITDFAVWKMARSAHQLRYVSLSDNPWSCECEVVEPFRLWLQDYSGVIVDKHNISCISAAVPSRVHQLTAFNDSLCRNDTLIWLDGESQRVPAAITVSLALVLVVATVAALLVYFRHEVQVLVYSRYGVRLHWLTHRANNRPSAMATELTRDDADKMFDAFVSYSSLDEELVIQLVDRLERGFDPPYKLCLHHRNFAGGALITESIIEAVERSCRTILLLSENFVRSEWCRFEFRAAYLQMLRDRRNRVIVVLVSPFAVDRSRIDREINYYLKTNTYLRWDDRLFWKKLCFALPDRQAVTVARGDVGPDDFAPGGHRP